MRRLNLLCSILLFLFSLEAFCQHELKGIVKDRDSNAVSYATVVLLKDEAVVSGSFTDTTGFFKFNNIPAGSFNLKISYQSKLLEEKLINLSASVNVGDIYVDNLTYLNEIQIEGDKTLAENYVNRIEFPVTESLIKNASDPYQILQHVPGLFVDIIDRRIQVNGQENILILVNNINRDASYISSIKPKDIERIDVVTTPSARYQSEGVSAIVNIVTRKKENGVSGGAGGTINPALNFGIFDGNLRYDHKKFSGYFIGQGFRFDEDNHITKAEEKTTSLEGTSLSTRKISDPYPFAYNSYSNKVGLEFSPAKNNFFILDFSFNKSDYTLESAQKGIFYINDEPIRDFTVDYLNKSSTSDKVLSFYYEKTFKSGNSVELYANTGFYKTELLNDYREGHNEGEYRQIQSLKNEKLSNDLQLNYSYNIQKCKLESGYRLYYQNLNFINDYHTNNQNDKSSYEEWRSYIYTNALGNLSRKFGYQAGMGLDMSHLNISESESKNIYQLIANAAIQYKIDQENNIRLKFDRLRNNPSVAALNPFERFTDSLKVISGNPSLKPFYTNRITMEYTYTKGKLYLSPSFNYSATSDYITTIGRTDSNGIYRITYQNIASLSNAFASLNANLKLFSWWSIRGELKYDWQIYNDDVSGVNKSISSLGFTFQSSVNYSKFTFQVNFYKNPDVLDAISRYENPTESLAQLQWKVSKNFTVNGGVRYLYPWKDKYAIDEANYKEYTKKEIKERHNMILFGLRYHFNVGSQQKRLPKIQNKDVNAEMKERL